MEAIIPPFGSISEGTLSVHQKYHIGIGALSFISAITRLSDENLLSGQKVKLLREKSFFPSVYSLSFWWNQSTITLVFEFDWNPKLNNDTRLCVALFLDNVLSSSLCFPLLGKEPFTLWVGSEQWSRFHEPYSVVSLALGNRSQIYSYFWSWL